MFSEPPVQLLKITANLSIRVFLELGILNQYLIQISSISALHVCASLSQRMEGPVMIVTM